MDLWAERNHGQFKFQQNFEAETLEVMEGGRKFFLIKPQTYMNLSGKSLHLIYQKKSFLKECPLIVLHDEVDLSTGRIKVKKGGGDAGHNGLKSIRKTLGHGDYFRVRLGVSRPVAGEKIEVGDYVLQKFPKKEWGEIADMLNLALDATELVAAGDMQKAQELVGKGS